MVENSRNKWRNLLEKQKKFTIEKSLMYAQTGTYPRLHIGRAGGLKKKKNSLNNYEYNFHTPSKYKALFFFNFLANINLIKFICIYQCRKWTVVVHAGSGQHFYYEFSVWIKLRITRMENIHSIGEFFFFSQKLLIYQPATTTIIVKYV